MKDQPISEQDRRRRRALIVFQLVSYGYLLAVPAVQSDAVRARFAARDIACADIGEIVAGSQVSVADGGASHLLWDFADAGFITGAARPPGR